MSAYVRKSESIDAEQVTVAVGDLAAAGDWLVKHTDGHLTVLTDEKFTEAYEAAPPAPIVEEAAAEPVLDGTPI